MRLKAACTRIGVLTLIGWLPLSACAAHVEPKCFERAAPGDSKEAKASPEVAADPVGLIVAQIPRHTSGQFETPERVLGFLFDKVASRDLIGSLAAFPVVEEYERVTGRAVPNPVFYYVSGLFKTAVVAQQIYFRYKQGLTKDERFSVMIMGVHALAGKAARHIEAGRV
jgi:hypothetical protein